MFTGGTAVSRIGSIGVAFCCVGLLLGCSKKNEDEDIPIRPLSASSATAKSTASPSATDATASATSTETPSSPFPPDPLCPNGRALLDPQYGPVRFREKVDPCRAGDVCGFFYLAASSLTCQDGGETALGQAKKMLVDSGVTDGQAIVLIDINGRRAAGIVFPTADSKQAFLTALGKPEDKLFTSYAVWRAYARQR
jgi:hypothetical protein